MGRPMMTGMQQGATNGAMGGGGAYGAVNGAYGAGGGANLRGTMSMSPPGVGAGSMVQPQRPRETDGGV